MKKKVLDDTNNVGEVLMDLSKAFDCIPHVQVVAKIHAYSLSMDPITAIYSYLNISKQGPKINDTENLFRLLLSILGPILLKIFINDLITTSQKK